MFRAWEEHQLGTPLYFLLQTMTDVLRSENEHEIITRNHSGVHYICHYEVDRLLLQLGKHIRDQL